MVKDDYYVVDILHLERCKNCGNIAMILNFKNFHDFGHFMYDMPEEVIFEHPTVYCKILKRSMINYEKYLKTLKGGDKKDG